MSYYGTYQSDVISPTLLENMGIFALIGEITWLSTAYREAVLHYYGGVPVSSIMEGWKSRLGDRTEPLWAALSHLPSPKIHQNQQNLDPLYQVTTVTPVGGYVVVTVDKAPNKH